MKKRCAMCRSTDFRLSHFSWEDDGLKALMLMYPLRCNSCLKRTTCFLPLALVYRQRKARKPTPISPLPNHAPSVASNNSAVTTASSSKITPR